MQHDQHTHHQHPNSAEHNICERLRELGHEGDGLPTVSDLLDTCERAGVDWREVLALGR